MKKSLRNKLAEIGSLVCSRLNAKATYTCTVNVANGITGKQNKYSTEMSWKWSVGLFGRLKFHLVVLGFDTDAKCYSYKLSKSVLETNTSYSLARQLANDLIA